MFYWRGMSADLITLSTAQQARSTAADVQARAEALTRWAEQSLMLCEAIWTLTRDKPGQTDEDLIARVSEIDASDGKLDGRVRHEPQPCPKCNRTSPARFDKCMCCGREREKTAFTR